MDLAIDTSGRARITAVAATSGGWRGRRCARGPGEDRVRVHELSSSIVRVEVWRLTRTTILIGLSDVGKDSDVVRRARSEICNRAAVRVYLVELATGLDGPSREPCRVRIVDAADGAESRIRGVHDSVLERRIS